MTIEEMMPVSTTQTMMAIRSDLNDRSLAFATSSSANNAPNQNRDHQKPIKNEEDRPPLMIKMRTPKIQNKATQAHTQSQNNKNK
jgi:hypothetical protein